MGIKSERKGEGGRGEERKVERYGRAVEWVFGGKKRRTGRKEDVREKK